MFSSNQQQNRVIPTATSSTASSSKLNHSVAHSKLPLKKKASKSSASAKKSPFLMVKSKSDLNALKTYPDSFTIISTQSPKRSPSAGFNSKRKKNEDEDDDSIIEFEWVKPPPEKLYEAASAAEKYLDEPAYTADHFGPRVSEKYLDEPAYIADHFGQRVSLPSSPIITDKIMIGSSHR